MNYKQRQDVLGLALDLHMDATGSLTDLTEENRAFAEAFLQRRVDNWSEGPFTSVFDAAVKLVLLAAIAETKIAVQARVRAIASANGMG